MPRNSLVNGKSAPDTGGTQLDETAYPILMALPVGARRGRQAVAAPHPPGRRLPGRDGALVRRGALGGAVGLLAVHDRRRDRRADRGVGDRREPRRHGAGPAIPGDRRRLPAQHQELGRDHHRPGRTEPTSSGFPRPATRTPPSPTASATAARPWTSAPSSTAASRSWSGSASCRSATRRPGLAGRVRQEISVPTPSGTGYYRYGTSAADGSADGYGDCYQPSQDSARVRGAVADHRHGHRAPVAGPVRRARRVRHGRRERQRREVPAPGDDQLLLRRRAGARAGLGRPGPGRLAVRQRPGHGVHRLHRRQGGRLGVPADLGPGPGTAADRLARHRP